MRLIIYKDPDIFILELLSLLQVFMYTCTYKVQYLAVVETLKVKVLV